MKKIITTTFFALLSNILAHSQDVITLRTGEQIRAKVTEISTTELKYKRFEHLDGPTRAISLAEVFAINYENGIREVINPLSTERTTPIVSGAMQNANAPNREQSAGGTEQSIKTPEQYHSSNRMQNTNKTNRRQATNTERKQMYGILAGMTSSTLSGGPKGLLSIGDIKVSRKLGVQFGMFSEFPLKNPKFGLQTEILFSQLGAKLERNYRSVEQTGTINFNCFQTRAHIQFKHAFSDGVVWTLYAGFNLAYALWASYNYYENGKEVVDNDQSFFGNLSSGSPGVGFGTALLIQNKVRIGVGYDYGTAFQNLSLNITYMLGK